MKIVIICYVYPPEFAPAGIMAQELAGKLKNRGFDVTVITGLPNHPANQLFQGYRWRFRSVEKYNGIKVIRVGHAILNKRSILNRILVYTSFAFSSFANGLTLGRHDVLVCLSTPLIGIWTAFLLARFLKAKFFRIIFDLWPENIRSAQIEINSVFYRFLEKIDSENCLNADCITTLSCGMKTKLYKRGIPREKMINVLPFWIDTNRIKPADKSMDWRYKYGIENDKFIALFAGTMGYISGGLMLLGVAEILKSYTDILIFVVGDGPIKQQLITEVERHQLQNISFLDFRPEAEVSSMYNSADLGLITLLPESGKYSVPSKILAYMSAGLPVVASVSPYSETARLINESKCGIAVASQEADEMADAIIKLYKNSAMQQQYSKNAHSYVSKYYSKNKVTKKYIELIQNL